MFKYGEYEVLRFLLSNLKWCAISPVIEINVFQLLVKVFELKIIILFDVFLMGFCITCQIILQVGRGVSHWWIPLPFRHLNAVHPQWIYTIH